MSPTALLSRGGRQCAHFKSCALVGTSHISPLKAELNPICHLLALLGGATIVVVSRLRVNSNVCFFRSSFFYLIWIYRYLSANRLALHILLYQIVAFVFSDFNNVYFTKYTLLLIYCAFVGLNNKSNKFNNSEDCCVGIYGNRWRYQE